MKKLNKKAILLPETLKMIIAVICIALLIMLAVKIYGIFSKQREFEKAKFSLKSITDKIRYMDVNNINKDKILMLKFYSEETTKDWVLVYYNEKQYILEEGIAYETGIKSYKVSPLDSCEKNCLCICPRITTWISPDTNSLKDMNVACNLGVCEYIPNIEINEKEELYKGIKIELIDLGIEKNIETNKFVLKKIGG